MTAQVWIAILVGLAATIDDIARRQIANWIPAAALAGGFGWQIGQNGLWPGAGYALAGGTVGFAVFLIFYLLGGMGGGDVKLMAGFGALLGTSGVLWAALLTALVGGVLAVGVLLFRGLKRMLGAKPKETVSVDTTEEEKQMAAQARESIPYAPAIVLGVWLALLPKG
jgi:prepilin peptidase CpaA